MSLTGAKAPAVEPNGNPGGGETTARRGYDIQVEIIREQEVEIELIESEPTIQQHQAYERFWKLVIERTVRERRLDRNA